MSLKSSTRTNSDINSGGLLWRTLGEGGEQGSGMEKGVGSGERRKTESAVTNRPLAATEEGQ